jgi:phosphatidate cytidylyltransferase
MLQRLLTGAVAAVLLLALLLLGPPWATAVLLVAVIGLGAWEWSAFIFPPARLLRAVYVLLTLGLLIDFWRVTQETAALHALLVVAALWWVVALVWVVAVPQRRAGRLTGALVGWLVLVPSGVALLHLRLSLPQGLHWLLLALFIVWVADSGAYFAGRALGRHKLAPEVSPGKTWEGAAGGLLGVGLLAWVAAPVLGQRPVALLGLCLVVGVFSVVGDLAESLFKRHAGLKDSGQLLPGHGGILDRLDSLFATAPLLLLGLLWLGVA